MIYEGVTFVEGAVSTMSLDDFVKMHVGVFWLDRTEKVRKKMLTHVHSLITGKDGAKKEE